MNNYITHNNMLKSCSCYKNRINSVFSNNVDTLIAIKSDTLYTTTTNNPDIYTNLAKVLKPINDIMKLYADGKIDDTVSKLKPEDYLKFASDLFALELTSNTDYETIRQTGTTTLSGMKTFSNQYYSDQEKISTLLGYEALVKQYVAQYGQLDSLNQRSFGIFNDVNVNVIKAEIPPEYEKYIQMYKPAAGSVFDPDKLASIKLNLTFL